MIEHIKQSLIHLHEPSKKNDGFKCAAVLIPLVFYNNQWQVILTRRAEHLKHHPGQISFPGGSYEKQDDNLMVTALRETHEEIGIPDTKIEIIGKLPQQNTISQYNVTPFVGTISEDYQITIDENEVAEVFNVPLNFLTDQTNQIKKDDTFNGKLVSYYTIQYQHYNIWGVTARILVNLSRRLNQLTPQNRG